MQALRATDRVEQAKVEELIRRYEAKIAEHRRFIEEHGEDPPEVSKWNWT
jgi:phosphoketolase